MSRGVAIAGMALALSILGNSAVTAQDQREQTLPASVGDLAAVQLIEVRDASGQVLLNGTFVTDKNTPKETEREAELKSPTGQASKGKVEVEIERKDGVVTADKLEIEVEKLPAMATLTLHIDGQPVGTLMTGKNGKAEITLVRKLSNGK